MDKKIFILSLCLLIGLIIPSAHAAHYVIGYVNDSLANESVNGKTITLWNPLNGITDNITDIVGQNGNAGIDNYYALDCEILSQPCDIGEKVTVRIEYTPWINKTVNITITGAGYDLAEDLILPSSNETQNNSNGPQAVGVTVITSSKANEIIGNAIHAQARNVSELSITGTVSTASWQGYYGSVPSLLSLADANGRTLYDWSQVNPSGEIYISKNQSINWNNIQCFNYSANGTFEGTEIPGATNQQGLNLTQLESSYGINADDVDGVDETFNLWGAGTHDAFSVAGIVFNEGMCRNTRIYDATGQSVANNYEEVLLYEPTSQSIVYTALLESNISGFDNQVRNFEAIVLEDGHNGDTSSTPYYFYLELT